ncbi:MAG: GAF domain-containing protein, partial [Anaerolineales bacterium]
MNKSSIFSTIIAAALTLSFTAQNLLLTPHLVMPWLVVLPQGSHFILGGLAFLFSMFILIALVFDHSRFNLNIVLLSSALLLAGLAAVYVQSGLIADSLPLALLIVSILGSVLVRTAKTKAPSFDWLLLIVPYLNITMAIVILLAPEFILPGAVYGRLTPYRLVAAAVYGVSGLLGLAAPFKPNLISKTWLARLLSLPWLGWALLFALPPFSMPSILPAAALGLSLALYNLLPWERVLLPKEDVLGHRIVRLTAIANIAVLAGITTVIVITEASISLGPNEGDALRVAREIAMACFNLFGLASLYAVLVVNISINGLMRTPTTEESDEDTKRWNLFVEKLVGPLTQMQSSLRAKVKWQERQIKSLNEQLGQERTRAIQFSLIKELSQQLEPVLDHTVSSQLTANVLQRAFGSVLVTIFRYEAEKSDFVLVAAAGQKTNTIPSGYRQSIQKGIIGRAGRTRKPQLVNNTAEDPDFITLEQQSFLSEMAVPLIYKNQVKGMIVIDDEHANAYNTNDIDTVDSAASQLLASWERSDYDTRLAQLVDGGIALSTILDPEAALDQIAIIAQKILSAHFVYVIKQDKKNDRLRTANAGYAPPLLGYLQRDPGSNELIQNALSSGTPFRIRDVRK